MPYATPNTPNLNADAEPRLRPSWARDEMRASPPMLILRAHERLDEALAQKRDPWPAYYAWTRTLDAWALGDPEFEKDMAAATKRRERAAKSHHGLEHAYQACAIMSVPYVKLMRRLGLFKGIIDLTPPDNAPAPPST